MSECQVCGSTESCEHFVRTGRVPSGGWRARAEAAEHSHLTLLVEHDRIKQNLREAEAALAELRKQVNDWNEAVETIIGRKPQTGMKP